MAHPDPRIRRLALRAVTARYRRLPEDGITQALVQDTDVGVRLEFVKLARDLTDSAATLQTLSEDPDAYVSGMAKAAARSDLGS